MGTHEQSAASGGGVEQTRRDFMRGAVVCAATLSAGYATGAQAMTGAASRLAAAGLSGAVMGANERVNLAILGLNGKGADHLNVFSALPNARVIAVCDPDAGLLDKAGPDIAKHQDLRRVFDMKDVDAVVIATPDHWHCLAAIWAFQAGKHAYVEKPVSHSIWESRQMVKAARKYGRIVQSGTQQRSCPAVQECAHDVQAGVYGPVKWVHCSKLEARQPIGKAEGPLAVPDYIDYNLWAGPAPCTPVMRKNFHYDWHWQWNWGTGETGNWGVHYIDDLRHILGWDDVPGNVVAAGNRWWDDDGETPSVLICLMEHRNVQVVIDIRTIGDSGYGGDEGAVYRGARSGNYILCEEGHIQIARGGGKAFDNKGKLLKQYKGDGGGGHAQNFIDAIREGNPALLNAEIEVGHLSTVMCHQANIAYRVGQETPVSRLRETFRRSDDATATIENMVTQLAADGVDFYSKPFLAGPKLTFDPKTEQFTGAMRTPRIGT